MLSNICPLMQNDNQFLRETALHFKNITKEYNEHKNELEFIYNPWIFIPIYDILGVFKNQLHFFPTIENNLIESNDYEIVSIGLSSLVKGDGANPHTDPIPIDNRFKRLHLALQVTPTSILNIKVNDTWIKKSWNVGRWMEFKGLDKLHFPINNDEKARIVLLVDVYIGGSTKEDLYRYYNVMEGLNWINNDWEKILRDYSD